MGGMCVGLCELGTLGSGTLVWGPLLRETILTWITFPWRFLGRKAGGRLVMNLQELG